MRRAWQWAVVVGCGLICYAPAGPDKANTIPAASHQRLLEESAAFRGPKITPEAPLGEVYRQVSRIAEEYLRPRLPRPAEVWKRPWNQEQALQEFHGFQERVRALESCADRLPLVSSAKLARMFAPWRRLYVEGSETSAETDAAPPPRGGPDSEVILGNGELVLSQTDLRLPQRGGVSFSLVRYYRSQVDYHGPLGPGWDHSCNQRIVAEGLGLQPKCLVWYTGQRAVRFTRQGQDWVPEPGAFYRLEMERDKIVVETAHRMRLEFEPAQERRIGPQGWRIARIAGRHDNWQANVLTFRYWPGSDVLREVEDPFGNRVRFVHDAHGRLSAVECNGLGVVYQYDQSGRLSAVTVPRVAVRLASAEDITWHYSYLRNEGGRNWLHKVIPPGGTSEKVFQYQMTEGKPGYGRVTRVSLCGRDAKIAPEEAVWHFTVEKKGNNCIVLYQSPAPLPLERWTFPIENGRVSCYPLSREIAPQNAVWQWKHNVAGQIVEEQRPLGGISRWRYDSDHPDFRFRGNLLEKQDHARPGNNPLGITKRGWRWEYHKQIALPISAVAYEVSQGGQERVLQRSSFEYDPQNLELVFEQMGEKCSRTVRNRFGEPVVVWDGRGCATVYRYYSHYVTGTVSPQNGGLVAETFADAAAPVVTAALRQVSFKADKASLPDRNAEGEPVNRLTRFRFDRQGNLIYEHHPGYQIERLWNKLGQLLAVVDTRRDLTVYDYDPALRRTAQWQRILRLRDSQFPGETRPDAAGYFAAERLAYDAFGRLSVWHPTLEKLGLENPRPPEVRYEYYPSGLLKKRITPAGAAVEILYDHLTGRQKELRLLSADASKPPLVLRSDMIYDPEGFLLSYREPNGQTYRAEPDVFGRALATVRPDGVRTETLYDGLDRLVHERVFDKDRSLLDERKYSYDTAGRRIKVDQHYCTAQPGRAGQPPADQWLIAEELRYDPEGNVIARRGWRPEAWQKHGYDGLGRLVWTQSPDGDRQDFYYQDDWLCLERRTQKHSAPESQEKYQLHIVTIRDERGQPWCTVSVGHDRTVGVRRALLTHYDSQGNLALELLPDATRTTRFYNTLGLLEREVVHAAKTGADKMLTHIENHYDPDGLLVLRTVHNRPLAFMSQEQPGEVNNVEKPARQDIIPARQDIPQVRKLEYDGFRRLMRETAPDGLVQQYTYGPDSRLTSLVRYRDDITTNKEVLKFEYDRLGRLIKLLDGSGQKDDMGRTLQRFDYDWQGNIVRAEDFGQPEHPIELRRSYDNLGQLLSEQVRCLRDRLDGFAVVYDYDMLRGKCSAALVGFDGLPAAWRKLEIQQDLTGRVRQIAKDGQDFCRLEYVGQKEVKKHFVESDVTETIRLDPFLEPEEQRSTDDKGRDLYQMHYLRDDLGRVIASSIRVPTKGWECSKFYDRDSAGNLVAEDTQAIFLQLKELAQYRKDLLMRPSRPGAPVDIGVSHVRRYEYDEAGNMIASFRGPATGRWPQGAELASSWDPSPRPVAYHRPLDVQYVSLDLSLAQHAQPPKQPGSQMPREVQRALASNRTSCKAQVRQENPCLASVTAQYTYDDFGRLRSYRSRSTGKMIRWELQYDALGRLVSMKGFEDQHHNSQQQANVEPAKPLHELRFAYDPFNRRIIKSVSRSDDNPGLETIHAMLYMDQQPLVKLRKSSSGPSPWIIDGQYIWGAGAGKVLAYYASGNVKLNNGEPDHVLREHLLYQDAALNVILSTRRMGNDVAVYDVASYWGMGQNSTIGVIQEAISSLTEEKNRSPNFAIDRVLDDRSARWFGNENPGFLTLKLSQSHRLSAMEIWAEKLPKDFRTYVVAEGRGPQPSDTIAHWENQHKENRVSGILGDQPSGAGTLGSGAKPHMVALDNRQGQEIVLVWDSCGEGLDIREFEVFVQPLHPGDLAFSGAIYDAETGLYYHGARYRLPELGGFISPDPLGFLGGDNLYAFANNDPLSWHDPDGRFAHVLLGAGAGAVLGAGSYLFKWWWTGEEWSWGRLGIYTAAGAASGAAAAATGGLSLALASSYGTSATASTVIAGAAAGAVGGGVHGAIQAGGLTYLETGDLAAALRAGGTAAVTGAALGAVGGTVGGAIASRLGGSLLSFVAAGAGGGGSVGAVAGAVEGYRSTGSLRGLISGAVYGGISGAVVGGAIGGSAWGVGRATGWIRPLPKQPEGLPDPRTKSIMVRTEPRRGDYGGVFVKEGYARHHIKPLSLGGTDTPDNIVQVPIDIHRQPHPGPEVRNAPVGTIFY